MTGGFFGVAASVNFHIDPPKGTDHKYIYIYYACMHACISIYIYKYLPFKGTFESMIFLFSFLWDVYLFPQEGNFPIQQY